MWVLVMDISRNMTEDFYNHFVDDATLIVVFSGRYFVLDKFDKTAWQPMVEYGKTVRVGPEWTMSIPVDYNKLYEVAAILTAPMALNGAYALLETLRRWTERDIVPMAATRDHALEKREQRTKPRPSSKAVKKCERPRALNFLR